MQLDELIISINIGNHLIDSVHRFLSHSSRKKEETVKFTNLLDDPGSSLRPWEAGYSLYVSIPVCIHTLSEGMDTEAS